MCHRKKCTLLAVIDGLCRPHYDRRRRMDDFKELRDGRSCGVDGCERPYSHKGYCVLHGQRLAKYGDPGPAGLLRAADGKGHLNKNGYRDIRVNGKKVLEHRYVMEQELGRPLRSFENVHHVNGVRHDNRAENLELWVKPQPAGQRAIDLAEWVLGTYPDLVADRLNARAQESA